MPPQDGKGPAAAEPFSHPFFGCLQLAVHIHRVQVFKSLAQALYKGFFALAQPYPRIIIFLVWFILPVGVADLPLQEAF